MSGRGGRREGAGRKLGSATRKTREIADRAAAGGIMPLEVMLNTMRAHYDAGRLDEAAAFAKDAAPYCHPRLSATEFNGTVESQPKTLAEFYGGLTDEQLESIAAGGK